MNINTRKMAFVNFNGQEMQFVKVNDVVVYESWKELTKSEVPPLKIYSSGADLIDYKMFGNAIQNGTPTPQTPSDFGCLGTFDIPTGKHIIPVKVSNGTETITTNIYLDEPLRKLGDYVDYIDFENKKVVRQISKYTFKGTESLSLRGQQPTNGTAIYTSAMFAFRENFDNLICTRFSPDATYQSKMIPGTCCFINSSVDSRFHFCLEGAGKTVAEVKAILKEWYDNGNPMVVLYPPNKGVPEETIELPNIPTLKGNITIEIDAEVQPSNLEIVYKGK